MGVFKKIKELIFGKEPIPNYPGDFALIDFSPIAFRLGVRDNKNKIISRYFINEYGNIEIKKYPYSEERVALLKEIHKIPVYDKTQREVRFPVFSHTMPGEAIFTQDR